MGFYSFYKIIKDLLRTFLGSKNMKIIIALIIAFMLVSYIMPVFATSDPISVNYNDYDFTFPAFLNDYYWAIYFYKASNGMNTFIVYSDTACSVNADGSQITFSSGTTRGVASYNSYNNNNLYMQNRINTMIESTSTTSQNETYTTYQNLSSGTLSVFCNYDLKTSNGTIVFPSTEYTKPHFDNTDTDLQNVSFKWLYIEPADFGIEDNLYLHILTVNRTIEINQNETAYYYDDTSFKLNKNSKYLQYFTDNESYPYYSIPKHKLSLDMNTLYYFVLSSSGSSITSSVGVITDSFDDTIFQVVSVNTSGVITQADVNSDNLQNIDDALSTNEDEDNLSESDLQLPENNINDPTSSGFLGFFTILYNGFCSGEPTSLVIQLPFIDKTVTIDPNLTYNILTRQEWLPLYALLQAFYWYVISRFIMLTIRDCVIHIKSIDFDIKNFKDTGISDIRGEML